MSAYFSNKQKIEKILISSETFNTVEKHEINQNLKKFLLNFTKLFIFFIAHHVSTLKSFSKFLSYKIFHQLKLTNQLKDKHPTKGLPEIVIRDTAK